MRYITNAFGFFLTEKKSLVVLTWARLIYMISDNKMRPMKYLLVSVDEDSIWKCSLCWVAQNNIVVNSLQQFLIEVEYDCRNGEI